MDLNEILTATQTVEVAFVGETINCEMYTAGINRLTAEQQAGINSDDGPGAIAVSAIPLLLKSWDLLWKGEALPVQQINDLDNEGKRKYPIPLALVNAIWEAGKDIVTGRPTEVGISQNISAQADNAEEPTAIQ